MDNNIVSRKKNNNGKKLKTKFQQCFKNISFVLTGGGGGDLTASPKYNKSNSRGYNKEIQQQKQYRANGNREQRNGANSRYKNHEQNNPYRVS